MKIYPYNAPIILNDQTFVAYGGQTGTFTAGQRTAAYLIAEKQATNYIGTFLLPTIVTGTWGYSNRIITDYGYVHQVLSVTVLSKDNLQNCTFNSETGCAFVWDDTYAYLDVSCIVNNCGCFTYPHFPYQVKIAYQAGLPTGTSSQPDILLALTIAAQISLNEMAYPSQNEGTGDIGIEEFSSMDYREKRAKMGRTAFGNSAKAYKAAQLLRNAVKLARPALLMR